MPATDIDKLVIYRRSDMGLLGRAGTPWLGANSTGSALAVPIGFDFRFDGVTYTSIDLFAYGYARLAGSETSANGANLFASNSNVILAPWWDNLETADGVGGIRTETVDVAPFRIFVVEWYCNLQAGQTATDYDRVRFELVLYESIDRIEFRYGEIETAGAPSRASYSASRGIKGVTTVDAANYRSFGSHTLDLGGSDTDTTSTLAAPTAWPAAATFAEPAWPMCGRLHLIDLELISGLQHPLNEPAWFIANAVNWLITHHCPPLVNVSPWQESQYATVDFVTTVTPSPDGLTYDVLVQTYTTSGGNQRISIDEDIGTMPIPTEDVLWNNLVVADALGTSAGWHEWTVFQVTPSVNARFFRITASHEGGSNILLGSVLIVPETLDDLPIADGEDYLPRLDYPSGAVPMCIAQIRQEGAAIHPEWYNRAWRTIAAVLRRKQMLWSSTWPDSTKVDIAATTARPRRAIGVAPASLPLAAQQVTVKCFAASSLEGAKITVAEQGGTSVTFDVNGLATVGYSLEEKELQLRSDTPVISVDAAPVGDLSPMSIALEWAPELGTADLILGTTPPPRLEYLVRLASRIAFALRAYAMTGLATALCRGKTTNNPTRLQWIIPPGVAALRPRIARVNADTAQAADDSRMFAPSSGLTANDEIVIPSPNSRGKDDYPPEGALVILSGAEVDEPTPPSPMDRRLESPTAASMEGAVRERVEVLRGVGMTLIPVRNPSL